jgi:uncharacterized membrane protein YqjE
MMDAPAPPPGSAAAADPPRALRGLLATTLDALRTRLDLAAVEFELYLFVLLRSLVWALGALACGLLGVAFAMMALVVALWDTHRMLAILGGSAVFVALAVTFGYLSVRNMQGQASLLQGSLDQLRDDTRRAGEPP